LHKLNSGSAAALGHDRQDNNAAGQKKETTGCPDGGKPAYVFQINSNYRYILAAELNKRKLPFNIFYTADYIAAAPQPEKK